jgi:hypothetical protein
MARADEATITGIVTSSVRRIGEFCVDEFCAG